MRSRSRKDDTSVLATIDGNTSFGSKRRNNKDRRRRSGGRRSSLSIESCGDEMLDEVTSLLDDGCENNNTTTNGRRIVFEDDDDDEEEDYLEPRQNVKRNDNDISKEDVVSVLDIAISFKNVSFLYILMKNSSLPPFVSC